MHNKVFNFEPGQLVILRDRCKYVVSKYGNTFVLVSEETSPFGYKIIPCSDYTDSLKHNTNLLKDIDSIYGDQDDLIFKCDLSVEISYRQAYCLLEKFKAPFMCEFTTEEHSAWSTARCYGIQMVYELGGPCFKFIVEAHRNSDSDNTQHPLLPNLHYVNYCRVSESLLKSDANET